ncbi:hypothetical protein C3L33_04477, partial [Rhododendron williamsianum]
MERSKKYVSSSTNRPPISPKPFTLIPSSTAFPMATSSSEGWQKSYFMTKPHQEPSLEVTNKNPPLVLSRNPITAVEPSSTNIGGITVKTEQGIDYELGGRNLDLNMDIRKLRRLLSNRISAKRSRLRKDQHTNNLEKKLKDLEAEVGVLHPIVESEIDTNKQLRMENQILKEKIRVQEVRAKLSLAQMKENQAEVKRYNELHAAQLRKWSSVKMEGLELDPALNFESLTIDPPKSLMD